jgi:hypothetical protein
MTQKLPAEGHAAALTMPPAVRVKSASRTRVSPVLYGYRRQRTQGLTENVLLKVIQAQRVLAEFDNQITRDSCRRLAIRGGERPADELV